MKTRLKLPELLLVLCSAVASTAAFGQTTYTWTNSAGGDIATAANWDPNGQPSGATIDIALFDGKTAGPLTVISSATGLPSTGFGTSGIILDFTSNQVSSVTFTSTVAQSAAYGLNSITIDSPTAAITLGASEGANLYNLFGRPAGAVHPFVNNSTSPATINGTVRWQAGGGSAYTLDFQGTGDWMVNNYCVNDNNAGMIITVSGPGTTTWHPTGYLGNSGINSPISINGGRLVLAGPHLRISNQAIGNNSYFEFNAPSQAQTLSGVISGAGTNIVSGGTLTLSGQSTYSGDTILKGGELVVNGAENEGASGPLGVGGKISFEGGTLGFGVNNIYDYSARFSTKAGQAYSLDTAGQTVTFTNAAGLSGAGSTLTKLGAGTLTLAGPSAYTGVTTVNVGRLVFQGSKAGAGDITVADSAILGVVATGTPISPAALTVGTSSGATLEFNNVNSTTSTLIAAGSVAAGGTITININSGALVPSTSYPLLSWSSGSAPAVSLGILNGFIGNLTTNGNSIQLNVTATAFTWTGKNNGSWDLTTANNWQQNGGPAVFSNGGPALFDDTLTGNSSVTISGLIQPTAVTVNNNLTNYSITSSTGNNIGGSATVTKSGSGILTLAGGANTYTGATIVSGGALALGTLANGGSASDIGAAASSAANLVLNGGTLRYTGTGASIDRLFTLGTAGGTIEDAGSGALIFNNSGSLGYSGNGPRTLTLTGVDTDNNTLAAGLADNGGATSLAKSGTGVWILTGTNTHSGVTTIASGLLQVGTGGASGSIGSGSIVNNAALVFNRTGSVTVSGAISGSGSVTNIGAGTVILAGNSSYTGGTTINDGTLQIGNGGATGQLDSGSPIINNGTLIFKSSSAFTMAGFNAVISGTGNVWVQGSGPVKCIGNNTYTGWTTINSGSSFQPTEGNQGNLASSVVTNNGTLILVRQDNNIWGYTNNIVGSGRVLKEVNNTQGGGDVTLAGTNSYTGGTFIAGGGIILGDGGNPGGGTILGNVIFTNSPVGDNVRFLTFFRPDDFTFSNNIISVVTNAAAGNSGRVDQNGPNTLTLTGTNTYPSGTVINAGTIQVGNGGTNGTLGPGPVTDNSILVWNRADDVSFGGVISGTGNLVQKGAGTLTLTAANTYSGVTAVSNGTLVISAVVSSGSTNSVLGGIDLSGGTLVVGGIASVSRLEVQGPMNINSGTLVASLNKTLSPSSTFYSVVGGLNAIGGSLKLTNVGPALVVGDKFTLFSQAVGNGAALSVTGGGATWKNNLAVDGSISVDSILVVTPPQLNFTHAGSSLQFSWTAGFKLQAQTNSISSANWADYPGGGTSPVTVPIDATKASVFFRLVSTP